MKKILPVLFVTILMSVSVLLNESKSCEKIDMNTGDCLMDMGGGDLMNLNTGELLMDMGGGDKIGLSSGDLYMDMGGGDLMNMNTGSLSISLD